VLKATHVSAFSSVANGLTSIGAQVRGNVEADGGVAIDKDFVVEISIREPDWMGMAESKSNRAASLPEARPSPEREAADQSWIACDRASYLAL
jgi:hypothetical protein